MKKLLTLLTLISSGIVGAQESVILSVNQFNFNIAPTSISYERRIDTNKSFVITGGFGHYLNLSASQAGGIEGQFASFPITSGSLRSYYNRRRLKKSNLQKNSGNYIGVFASYQFEELNELSTALLESESEKISNVLSIGPVWGIERNFASGIHFGFNIGPGFKTGKHLDYVFTLVGNIEFGFVLASK